MSQKNKENPVYGNITLPQIVKFIVEIVGKDSLLYFNLVDENTLNDAYKEKGAFEKYKVNAQDYSFQFTYKDSIFGRIYKFFEKLEDEFTLLPYYKDFFMDYCVTQLLVQIAGTRPFETKQTEIPKKIIFFQPGTEFNKKTGEQKTFLCNPQFVDFVFFGSTSDFDVLIREYQEKSKISFEDFYKKITKISKLDEDSIRNALKRCRKMNISPRWEIFYPLLQVVSESDDDNDRMLTNKFLHQYFYKNFREAICHLSVKKDLLVEFEQLSKNYSENPYRIFYDKHLDVEKTGLHDIQKYAAYFDPLLEKNSIESVKKFHSDFDELHSELPHSIVFFQNWFCAKDYVYRFMESGNLEELSAALKWYRAAFDDGKYFAGKNLEKFLIEGIAVGFYFEWKSNPKQMRDRILKASDISNHDTKTPIPASIKALYDFAYAFDFVLNEKEDAYNYFYHCHDNFWNTFPPQTKHAEEIRGKDFVEEMGFKVSQGDIDEEIRKTLAKVTDKTVNTRLPTDHNVAYTPLSYAICNCQWDFVQNFLEKIKFPSLDVNVQNTNNTYPILELLTKLKSDVYSTIFGDPRYLNRTLPNNENERFSLFNEILLRTSKTVLFTCSNHRKISLLQEALETFDMKYIKSIVDKMTDDGISKFPEEYRISADEVSPLYYAITLKKCLFIDFGDFVRLMKEPPNIQWENFAVPGMTLEQKQAYIQNFMNGNSDMSNFFNSFMKTMSEERSKKKQEFKSNGLFDECVKNIDESISLLIERSENVDSFVKHPGDEQKKQLFVTTCRSEYGTLREKIPEKFHQGVNCLLLAAENDDVTTCRKLILAGADVTKVIGFAPEFHDKQGKTISMPNSFVFRCIYYESWNTLRMFLTEFKEKAQSVMHKGDFEVTPLVVFIFIQRQKLFTASFDEKLNRLAEFTDLFLSCGASLTESTELGCAEYLLNH
ncbi:MAG: hypothetical protein IJP61_09115 [Treponema sp.]|nr:hypothetical protein [Treponema sp.]